MFTLVLLAALGAASVPRPDSNLTPGARNPVLTKATLCSRSFRTTPYRHVTNAQKRAVCDAYGISKGCPGKGYEIDHLISLELGGSNAIENLWPQPADRKGLIGFHTKDVVENRAHAAVCDGRLTLKQAQQGISTDWYGFGTTNGFIGK